MKAKALLKYLFFFFVFTLKGFSNDLSNPLKVLHLTFHKGCENEFNALGPLLNLDVTTWHIQNLDPQWLDGESEGNALYNIGHKRAGRIWELHHDEFDKYDIILTSDTAPLARIFLQNGWKKPLVIWVCNRFDYSDTNSLDCNFPENEFYNYFRIAPHLKNVHVIAYTRYEQVYAHLKGVDLGPLIIKPTGLCPQKTFSSLIPSSIKKNETFFLPPYYNEQTFMNAQEFLTGKGIPTYCGRYKGPKDLKDFKAIIHLPYAWSNFALFENLLEGMTYLLPSKKFMRKLIAQDGYWLSDPTQFYLSEWYDDENAPWFIYFDSWEHLKHLTETVDFNQRRKAIQENAEKQKNNTLLQWKQVFDECRNTLKHLS